MHISNICTNDLQKKKFPKLKTEGAFPTKRYTIFGQEIACLGIEMVKIAGSWQLVKGYLLSLDNSSYSF